MLDPMPPSLPRCPLPLQAPLQGHSRRSSAHLGSNGSQQQNGSGGGSEKQLEVFWRAGHGAAEEGAWASEVPYSGIEWCKDASGSDIVLGVGAFSTVGARWYQIPGQIPEHQIPCPSARIRGAATRLRCPPKHSCRCRSPPRFLPPDGTAVATAAGLALQA